MNSAPSRRTIPMVAFFLIFMVSLGLVFGTTSKAFNVIMEDTLRRSTESSHGDMVLFASSALKEGINELIDIYQSSQPVNDWHAFAQSPQFLSFDGKVRDLFFGTNVVKIKIYANDGYTVFSTDANQIGQEKSEVEEVTHALRGRSSSQFSFRENFVALTGNKSNIEVVSSYHPLKTRLGIINGVVEVYSDRSSDFVIAESNVKDKLAKLIIVLALTLSSWLIAMIFYSLQSRTEDY